MLNNNKNSSNDISPSTRINAFAEYLVNIVFHQYLSFDGLFYTDRPFIEVYNGIFGDYDQTRSAIIYLDKWYKTGAWKTFKRIKDNAGNIHWFTKYVNCNRATLFNQVIDYEKCLHFSVYLAVLATNLHQYGVRGVLKIAAEHIAEMISFLVYAGGMDTLDSIVLKYAALQRKREARGGSPVHELAYEDDDTYEMHTSDEDLNQSSTVIRSKNEIVTQRQCHHLNNNELMGTKEIKGNLIPNQTVPFCVKSQTSSSEPTVNQMHPDCLVCKNSHLDFTAIPGTSRDTNVIADHPFSQSQSMLATTSPFKRRISNESGESENNTAKQIKTDSTISNNQDVKIFRNNIDFNAPSSSDSD